jgi:hypothetical protein
VTTDQLRTGAALCRALVEGDDSARGPLSDWVEEFGLPWPAGSTLAADSAWLTGRAIGRLRDGRGYALRKSGGDFVALWFADENYAWLGTWPKWAWDGGEPPCPT